ncbi:MAG TPA: polysaccharide biosynthesis tyrosine autokinase [Longimicrobiaceae bacterium]|nr:polysaccharide biosynthesis tyrosine autokinase [Longimicrobiaceae bacterium]
MAQLSPVPEKHLYLPSGAAGQPGLSELEGGSFAEYLGALRRRYWVILLVTAIGLALAAFKVRTTERPFVSKAVVEIASEDGAGPTGGLAGLAASLGGGGTSLDSHVEIIRSRALLGQVVDSLGLRLTREVPDLWRTEYQPVGYLEGVRIAPDATAASLELGFDREGYRVQAGGSEAAAAYGAPVEVGGVRFTVPSHPGMDELTLWVVSEKAAVDELLEHLRAFPRERTNIVDVVVTGYDPLVTEKIANVTAEVYRRHSSRRSRVQAERRREFVEEQLRTGEALLADAQNRLTEHRRSESLFSTRAEMMTGQVQRGELELQRAELDANRQIYGRLLAQLQGSRRAPADVIRTIVANPELSANPTILGLYERLSRYEATRDSLATGPYRVSASNPDLQRTDSLIAIARNGLVEATRSHVEWLDARIRGLDAISARSDSTMRRLAGAEPEELRLMLEVESFGEAVKQLREKYYTAGIAEAAGEEKVAFLDRALPGEPTGSGPVRSLAFGLIFGVMVGAGGAIALDGLKRSIRKRGELERILRVPELGVIPRSRGIGEGARLRIPGITGSGRSLPAASPDTLAAVQVYSTSAEAYRTLRTNLIFAQSGKELRSLVVTSPSGSEGKTTTAANVAVAFAQQGTRVLLVDCDFYRARLHQVFGVQNSPGLSGLLLGTDTLEQVVRPTGLERVSLIPAGPLPPVNPTDLLGGDVMRMILDSLAGEFDLVILDTPPVLTSANAPILGTQVDGVVLVVRAGRTTPDACREAVQQMSTVGARVLGAVLNDPDGALGHRRGYYDEAALNGASRNGRGG